MTPTKEPPRPRELGRAYTSAVRFGLDRSRPVVTRATAQDIPWILDLIDANRAERLTPHERSTRGFVQGKWNPDILAELLDETGVFVAHIDGEPSGVLITSPSGRFTRGPAGRVNALAAAAFPDRRVLLYGPTVVHSHRRRRGVLRALFREMTRELHDQFDHAVAFVEDTNEASAAAHERLGFTPFAQFAVDDRAFTALGVAIDGVGAEE